MSIYYHEKIDCKILRSTPNAHLIHINEINSFSIYRFNDVKKYLNPIEMWCPKSWFKKDFDGNDYIWSKGFYNNLNKLIEKRKKNTND